MKCICNALFLHDELKEEVKSENVSGSPADSLRLSSSLFYYPLPSLPLSLSI